MKKIPLFTLILVCCGFLFWSAQSRSTQDNELKFSHKLHVEENELECEMCHSEAEASLSGTDNLMPDKEICAECHEVEEEEECQLCHSDLEDPQAFPRIETYSSLFSHEKHITAEYECQDCHINIAAKESVLPYLLPKMMECVNCHGTKSAAAECETCHMPGENLKPPSHSIDFVHSHSDLADYSVENMSANMNCSNCHQQQYCQDCHEGDNLDRITHPLNFQFTHALSAQGKERDCAVCHTERQFCIECHQSNNIRPHNHTAGWAITNIGGRHRDEALNDLESCMACHEQNAELICQKCHIK